MPSAVPMSQLMSRTLRRQLHSTVRRGISKTFGTGSMAGSRIVRARNSANNSRVVPTSMMTAFSEKRTPWLAWRWLSGSHLLPHEGRCPSVGGNEFARRREEDKTSWVRTQGNGFIMAPPSRRESDNVCREPDKAVQIKHEGNHRRCSSPTKRAIAPKLP